MITVTAPTGTIGAQVVDRLLEQGAPVRVVVRDPARLSHRVRDAVDVIEGSHADPDVIAAAFAGTEALFWLVPPNPQAASVEAAYVDFAKPACAALPASGIARVVGISALGRGTPMAAYAGFVTATLAVDDMMADTGVRYRALVLPSFMDNLLRQRAAIAERGMFFGPISGDRALPTCATRDIAAAAVRLLTDPSWTGAGSVPVLGPQDLSFEDMAAVMSDVLGRCATSRSTETRMRRPCAITECRRPWPRACSTWRSPKTPGWTTPSRAPRNPRLRPHFGNGASTYSSRP